MAYHKKPCGCGHGHHHLDGYVDTSKLPTIPWDDATAILGFTECGNLAATDKPEYELTEEDRGKLDGILTDGDGSQAKYDDGTYKPTYTKDQTDGIIGSVVSDLSDKIGNDIAAAVENAVMYNDDDDIELRAGIIMDNNRAIEVKRANGNKYKALELLGNNLFVGDFENQTSILTLSRPNIEQTIPEGAQHFEMAYLDDVEQLRTDVDGMIGEVFEPLEERVTAVEGKASANSRSIAGLEERVDDLVSETIEPLGERVTAVEGAASANRQSIADLRASTEAGFDTVNDTLDALDVRVSRNSENIAQNSSDIESLREDLAARELFRGYFLNTAEVTAIPNPVPGNYAWNAESGTVWYYNGTTWYDTTVPIPDQTVEAYDADPLMDGAADAGSTNRYARGDHRHPSDASKADAADLDSYLPLAGNSQAKRITGDVWQASGNRFRFSNSGNSSLGQNTDSNTTELIGNGTGGVDIITANGTVKANGAEVAVYDANDDIRAHNDIYLANDRNLFGMGADGSAYNLIQKSRFGIIDAGSTAAPFNISSSVRPTVQLSGETGAEAHDIALLEDIADASGYLQTQIDENAIAIALNANGISANASDIAAVIARLADEENFRGYKLTTADVTAIVNPQNGNYAYNVESGTIWIYNGLTWADSLEPIPDGAVQAYDSVPLMDGVADAGSSNRYSRGDHRHPTDTSRASTEAVENVRNIAVNAVTKIDNYMYENDALNYKNEANISANTSNISSLTERVSAAEGDISTLQAQAETIGTEVNGLSTDLSDVTARVGVNELNIGSLFTLVHENENFKGYFLTNAELTQTPGTQGDFAWSAESGTIWIYDQSIPSWTDSGKPIPEEAVTFYGGDPLVNGVASPGESTQVSRGDHVHPSDPTKVDVTTLADYQKTEDADTKYVDLTSEQNITGNKHFVNPITAYQITPYGGVSSNIGLENDPFLKGYFSNLNTNNLHLNGNDLRHELADMFSRIEALEAKLAGVSGFWAGTEAEYDAVDPKDTDTYYHTYEE